MNNTKLICVAVPALCHSHQSQLRGVFEYARKAGWRVEIFDHGPYVQPLSESPLLEACDGMIMCDIPEFERMPAAMRRKPVVLVDCSRTLARHYPSVHNDNASIGGLAAKVLRSKRFASYAFMPREGGDFICDDDWSAERGRSFSAVLTAAGKTFIPTRPKAGDQMTARERTAEWLRTLPKPVAILAANDRFARLCANAAELAGYTVPDDVAILGVDDDDLICETSDPGLSSVLVDFEGCGRKAAKLLDDVLRKAAGPEKSLTYGPLSVTFRASTREPDGKTNWRYAKARAFIERRATDGIGIVDVAKDLGVSVRSAEYLFASAGTTVARTITAAKLEAACRELLSTRKPLTRIAVECGFSSSPYFVRVFSREKGMSPGAFRAKGQS